MKTEIIENFLNEHKELLEDIIREINNWNSATEHLIVHEFIPEEFDEILILRDVPPHEIARAIYYGKFDYMDDYFYWDEYGNLSTMTENAYQDMLVDAIPEVAEQLIEEWENLSLDADLERLLSDLTSGDNLLSPDTSPQGAVRNDKGQIIGTKGLAK